MGWKIVHLTTPCKIKVKSFNLLLLFYKTQEEKILVIKDINFILFDNNQFSITAQAIELLASQNIATLFIDKSFHPSAILLPYYRHSTITEIAHHQISISSEFRDKIWQEIIKAKIYNQSKVLEFFNIDKFQNLLNLRDRVALYDTYNHEAQSARVYWGVIFDKFKRDNDRDDIINSMLNYIYAIVRALIARNVSASGMLPIFGIWHNNRYNSFNLVDDLIEVFRPICDMFVKILYHQKYSNYHILDINIKRDLVSSLIYNSITINNIDTTLPKAIDIFVSSFKKSMIKSDTSIMVYPYINQKFFRDEWI